MISVKTRIRSTMQQINLLTEYMESHPRLANGEFYGAQGKLQEQGEWQHLRAVLNEHGPDKSIDQWKVTWRDLRRKQRTEASVSNQNRGCTGNVTTVPVSSDQTIKILNVMGTERVFDKHGEEKPCILPESLLEIQTEEEMPDHHTPIRKRKLGNSSQAETSKSIADTMNANPKELTEFDAIGINTAIKISKMDSIQAIYAESLITNVLRRGLLNKLTDETHLCDECTSNNN
ncbi:hypothetical protein evm_012792 [Chilo suppressalis]|nr:hypothetical protein evm_012792 [Chilo suppressalis]